ncbi:unnamed protein product [Penicillium salamii]|nr:unnamed protein product [Penicillium salamii]CAG8234823.1 unnamed protein product [Penicillium salamii]CAG8371192.1 unnamed protein product [Penicillium salamii]
MPFSSTIARPLQLGSRAMQWASSVIVMGLTAHFIHHGPRGQHILYQEVIAVLSVVFFLPGFISPFLPKALGRFVLGIDIVFSYLWLTSFIFSAQDYSTRACYFTSPSGVGCTRKKANEAFIFLALYVSFLYGNYPVSDRSTVSSPSSACSLKLLPSGPIAKKTPTPPTSLLSPTRRPAPVSHLMRQLLPPQLSNGSHSLE